MSSIFEFVKIHSDQSFLDLPLDEVDFLIFNELSYLPFDNYLTEQYTLKNPIKLIDLYHQYWVNHQEHHHTNAILATADRHRLFTQVIESKRYQEVQLSSFRHNYNINTEKQFCAATYTLPDETNIIVYRGTDDTLIGWKEDFKLAYQETIPAQLDAATYLRDMLPNLKDQYYLTGHSKGGNLALYAALSLEESQFDKIEKIYLFDSPGLTENTILSQRYQQIRPKVVHYIPEDSIIGRMMYHDLHTEIVESNLISFFQHNTINWKINQSRIERADKTTDNSDITDVTLKEWCANHSKEALSDFFDYAFNLLSDAGLQTLNELNDQFLPILKEINHLSNEGDQTKRQHFLETGQDLIAIWRRNQQQLQAKKKELRHASIREFFEQLPNSSFIEDQLKSLETWLKTLQVKE